VDLADVVEERCPPESVPIRLRKPELPREEVGERSDALAVSPGLPIVCRERGHEREDLGRRSGGFRIHAVLTRLTDTAFELADVARAACHREAGRRAVREDEGESEEHGERQEALADELGDRRGNRRCRDETEGP
jgi:hypothetical protein